MHRHLEPHHFHRRPQTIAANSLTVAEYLTFAGKEMPIPAQDRGHWPGTTRCTLALSSLCVLSRWRKRPWVSFLLLTRVFAFLFSLRTNLQFGEMHPWNEICQRLPIFNKMRNIRQFAIFTHLTVVWLAFLGLQELLTRLRRSPGFGFRLATIQACAMIAVLEVLPLPRHRL